MKAIFLLNGKGQRFKEAGYQMPKPLLLIGKKRVLQYALETVELLKPSYEYLISQELERHPIGLFDWIPKGCWHFPPETPGPIQTALTVERCLQTEEDVLLCDGDSFMHPEELLRAVTLFRTVGATGGLTVRQSTDPSCAYAEFDPMWWVSTTRDQDPFTPWSATGPYWFASGHAALKALIKAHRHGLHQIASIYNYLDGRTKATAVGTFQHLGTPDAYEQYRNSLTVLHDHEATAHDRRPDV